MPLCNSCEILRKENELLKEKIQKLKLKLSNIRLSSSDSSQNLNQNVFLSRLGGDSEQGEVRDLLCKINHLSYQSWLSSLQPIQYH